MSTGVLYRSDLYNLNNIVANPLISYPKELIIGILRDFFSQDSYYHYVRDNWGFPKVVDHTDLPSDAGINDNLTTRIFIGEKYKHDVIYYPAVLVYHAAANSVPISLNREKETVQYSAIKVVDGYGNERLYSIPTHFVFAGAWEGSLTIDVISRSSQSRDEITELISLCLIDIRFEELLRAGLLVKTLSVGSPSEADDRNDKLYRQSVTINYRTEWRREIPITNLVEMINICVDLGRVDKDPPQIAPNLTVSTSIELVDEISDL